MRIEVLNTGSELLLGSAVNTHLAFLGERLFSLGLRIARQECVPDGEAIGDALRETFGRADVVIVTGGLGPTSDDLTRDLVAKLLGRPLARDERVMEHIREIYRRFDRPVSESIARQAQVPNGAEVLWNPHGTAPGLYVPSAPSAPASEDTIHDSRVYHSPSRAPWRRSLSGFRRPASFSAPRAAARAAADGRDGNAAAPARAA